MRHIKQLLFVFLAAAGLTSCLKEDRMNIDPENTTQNILTLEWPEAGSGSTINSGMQYFSGSTLLYPASHEADTANIYIKLAGASALDHDVNLTLGIDESQLGVNYANDSIVYQLMPDSLYDFVSDSYTLKAGERYASYQVIFYPSKMDPTKNYMLPVTAGETGGVAVSDNYGHIYFHTIGNAIAGGYNWDFKRFDAQTQDPAKFRADLSWVGDATSFTPVNGSTISVESGYIAAPMYISFTDNGGGNLTDFTAELDGAYLTANGITLVSGPTLTVSDNNTKFIVNYVVFNGAAYRNVTDTFYK